MHKAKLTLTLSQHLSQHLRVKGYFIHSAFGLLKNIDIFCDEVTQMEPLMCKYCAENIRCQWNTDIGAQYLKQIDIFTDISLGTSWQRSIPFCSFCRNQLWTQKYILTEERHFPVEPSFDFLIVSYSSHVRYCSGYKKARPHVLCIASFRLQDKRCHCCTGIKLA